MLGRAYLYISEMANSKYRRYAQRLHRRGMIKSNLQRFKDGSTQALTAPTACLRNIWNKITYAKRYGRKLAGVLRRKGVNGK